MQKCTGFSFSSKKIRSPSITIPIYYSLKPVKIDVIYNIQDTRITRFASFWLNVDDATPQRN